MMFVKHSLVLTRFIKIPWGRGGGRISMNVRSNLTEEIQFLEYSNAVEDTMLIIFGVSK